MTTLRQINKVAKIFQCELIHNKREGYFYWVSNTSSYPLWNTDTAVYIEHVESMTVAEWILDLIDKVNQVR